MSFLVVGRLHASVYPPLDESLLLVFARLIHSSGVESILGFLLSLGRITVQEKKMVKVKKNETDKYASELKPVLTPSTIDPVPFLIQKWLGALSDDSIAPYPSKVLYLALAKLLNYVFTPTAGVEALRNMECRGYVIVPPKSSNRKATRSQTAGSSSHEPEYTKVPLSTKLISLFLSEWDSWNEKHQLELKRAMKRAKKAAGEEVDEDDDDDEDFDSEDYDFEDDEDDDDDDAFISKMRGKMGGGPSGSPFANAEDYFGNNSKLISLSQMLDYHADDIDEFNAENEEEDYPESVTDPLNEIDLGPFLQNYLKEFASASNGAFLQETARWLNDKDKKLLETALQAQPPQPKAK